MAFWGMDGPARDLLLTKRTTFIKTSAGFSLVGGLQPSLLGGH